jgi:antitoxin (DNA-binding transcriptional repressor) of toxin-antitoxin stability system
MTTISVTDFALHLQNYLDQVTQGVEIRIQLHNEQFIALVAESAGKQYSKNDLLEKLSYQGDPADSQHIDALIY